MDKIKPLGDRVVVKLIEPDEKTQGGVILVNPADQREMIDGIIVEVGPGRSGETATGVITVPVNLKVGDKVLFAKSVGAQILLNKEKHRILRESDVIAVYESA